jgi:hypothetical protein
VSLQKRTKSRAVKRTERNRFNASWANGLKQFKSEERLSHQIHSEATVLGLNCNYVSASNVNESFAASQSPTFAIEQDKTID